MAKKTPARALKVNTRRFDAGKARRDLDIAEYDHDAIARPIWSATERCANAISPSSPGEKILVPLMRAMRETHSSMRAVFTAAERIDKSDRPTGHWVDMLLLA